MVRNPVAASPVPKPFKRYAVELKLVRSRRWKLGEAPTLASPRAVRDWVVSAMGKLGVSNRERLMVIYLNIHNQPLGIQEVSVGGRNSAAVHIDEVLKGALLTNANAVFLVHNHPGGRPEPSADDRAITVKLYTALQLLNIELLDHIIIAETNYTSFVERGIALGRSGAHNPVRYHQKPYHGELITEGRRPRNPTVPCCGKPLGSLPAQSGRYRCSGCGAMLHIGTT